MLTGTVDILVEENVPAVRAPGLFCGHFDQDKVDQDKVNHEFFGDDGQCPQSSEAATACLDILTPRQHQIMDLILAGERSKNIAADLGISRRTVENHRAAIMKKTGSNSIPSLARLAFVSAMNGSRMPNIQTGRLPA